jgi:hypothetical protein
VERQLFQWLSVMKTRGIWTANTIFIIMQWVYVMWLTYILLWGAFSAGKTTTCYGSMEVATFDTRENTLCGVKGYHSGINYNLCCICHYYISELSNHWKYEIYICPFVHFRSRYVSTVYIAESGLSIRGSTRYFYPPKIVFSTSWFKKNCIRYSWKLFKF